MSPSEPFSLRRRPPSLRRRLAAMVALLVLLVAGLSALLLNAAHERRDAAFVAERAEIHLA